MMSRSLLVTFVLLIALFMQACGLESKETLSDKQNQTEQTLLFKSDDGSVALTSEPTETDVFSTLTVTIDGNSKTFPWVSESNPSFYPEVAQEDIDKDKQKEIIIVLSSGHGTGVSQQRLHVLRRDFSEIAADDPVHTIPTLVDTKLNQEKTALTVKTQNNEELIPLEDSDVEWFDKPAFGNIVKYRVQEGKIITELPLQMSITLFPAVIEGTYEYSGGALKIQNTAVILP